MAGARPGRVFSLLILSRLLPSLVLRSLLCCVNLPPARQSLLTLPSTPAASPSVPSQRPRSATEPFLLSRAAKGGGRRPRKRALRLDLRVSRPSCARRKHRPQGLYQDRRCFPSQDYVLAAGRLTSALSRLMHRGRWNDQAGDEEEMEALPWPPRTFSSTDPSHYALGASSSSPYASFSPPSPAERYFQRSGGGALRGTPPYSASSSPPYSSPRPPLLHPRPLLPSTPYAYTSFSPPPFLQAQPSAFPLRPPPLHGLPPRSAPLPAHSSLPSRPTAHGHQHSSSFPPYLPHQGSGVNSTGLRDGNGRIQRVGRRSSRDEIGRAHV